jgi:DnaK suppressor protein
MLYNLFIKTTSFLVFLIYTYMENLLKEVTLAEIEQNLLAQKERLVSDLADLVRPDSHESDNTSAKFPEYGDKPDENAQEIADYSTNLATEKVLEKSLADIESALERIKKGTYGTCKYCNNPIPEKRLLARPTASSCVACKTELQGNE